MFRYSLFISRKIDIIDYSSESATFSKKARFRAFPAIITKSGGLGEYRRSRGMWEFWTNSAVFFTFRGGVPPFSAEPEKVGVPRLGGYPLFRLSPPPHKFVQVPRTPIYTPPESDLGFPWKRGV